jgi:thiamine biosynthesis lipoprotein
MPRLTLARHAMNTRFELVLHGDNPVLLRAAGEAALEEVGRIECQMSLFNPTSEIARVNALASREPVRVSPEVFALLTKAQQLSRETNGTFDITMAPLLRCWGLLGRNDGRVPTDEELSAARGVCGMSLVELDASRFTVRFQREGVILDLGAIGKGYGVEQAMEILRESGVEVALLHGGTSTVAAIGQPPYEPAWTVAVEVPGQGQPLRIPLRDEALSVSAVSGKSFAAHGQTLGHVLDPRSGRPVAGAHMAAVVLPSATETDALSTALLVGGAAGFEAVLKLRPGMRALVTGVGSNGSTQPLASGIELTPS